TMDSIKMILQGILRQQNLDSKVHLYHSLEGWETMVGSRIARHCQPKNFREGILSVVVDSPAWMQQLRYLEEDIRKKVNEAIGSATVTKIHFQIGELVQSDKGLEAAASSLEWERGEIDSDVRARIDTQTAEIHDEQMKEQLKRFFARQYKVLQYRRKHGSNQNSE
ncbi:MAG TPA: DUF721 domain-containing protein, partial [Thermodesulfobacteriota bacterium]|nr:DUF721 domain-containing protein [Thermodesulfobacteriota bacterium]